jgi:hypothetical protein
MNHLLMALAISLVAIGCSSGKDTQASAKSAMIGVWTSEEYQWGLEITDDEVFEIEEGTRRKSSKDFSFIKGDGFDILKIVDDGETIHFAYRIVDANTILMSPPQSDLPAVFNEEESITMKRDRSSS